MFALLTAPGPEQTVLSTLDAALGQARAFAKRQRVRVWMEHGDAEFTLVDDFRVGVAAL